MSRLHYFTILLIIILLAIASGGLFKSLENKSEQTQEAARHDPDYFLEKFTATMMDKDGLPSYKVTADYLEHYPDDDSMALKNAYFEFFENNQLSWTAKAKQVLLLKHKDEIQLQEQIELNQVTHDNSPAINVTTSELIIFPERGKANTTQAIQFKQGNNLITAIGMRADMKTNHVEFLSKTRSQYVIQK